MALSKTVLSSKIKSKIISIYGGGQAPDDDATLTKFCNAIAEAVVEHINEAADVEIQSGDLTVAPGSFSNAGGPVTGTGQVNPTTLVTRIK